ncbi:UNVERIFIED_CONTAM: hypothetical protein FKN15_069920 [Acipenser sinensis]
MQPPQSYSVGGQRSSGQLTGKPAGTRPDYMGGARPIVHRPLGTPIHGRQWNSLDSNRQGASCTPRVAPLPDAPLGSPIKRSAL